MYPHEPWDDELWPTMCAKFGAEERGFELPQFLELYTGLRARGLESSRDSQRDFPTQLPHRTCVQDCCPVIAGLVAVVIVLVVVTSKFD